MLLITLLALSPALFIRYGFDLGRFDVLGFAATIGAFLLIERDHPWLAGFCGAAAMLVHEAYIVIGVPIVVAYAWRRGGPQMAASYLAWPAAFSGLIALFGRYEGGLPQLTAYFSHQPGYLAILGQPDEDAIAVLVRGLSENVEFTRTMFWAKRAYIHIPIIVAWGALVGWFYVRFYRENGLRRDAWFYSVLSPLLLSVIASDYYRWVSMAATHAFFVVIFQCRELAARKAASVLPTAPAVCLLATTLLGPISNTKSFPVVFQTLERVTGWHLTW